MRESGPAPAFESDHAHVRESGPAPTSAPANARESAPSPEFDFASAPLLESGPAPAFESDHAQSRGSAPSGGLESWPPLQHAQSPNAPHDSDRSPPSAVHAMPPPPLTESQEIVLPDPIPREELSSESGELLLNDEKPSSGSFSLDEEDERSSSQPPAPEPTSSRRLSSFVADDVEDALEGSEPLSIGNAKARLSKAPPFKFDRDPDAEFDALLSEATDPGGIPTGGIDSGPDELLGLDDEDLDGDLHADLATAEFDPGASSVTEAVSEAADELAQLMLEDSEDSTEVLDRTTLDAIEASAPEDNPFVRALPASPTPLADEDPLADFDSELDVGELEILMDEDQPPTKAAPPPPPPAPSTEKRPSGFLGRFFGRNERE
jgi:hypothetical protein